MNNRRWGLLLTAVIVLIAVFPVGGQMEQLGSSSGGGGGGGSGAYDLNGGELTLDADGDTSAIASTDDQWDITIGGSILASFRTNGLFLPAGSNGITILYNEAPTATNPTIVPGQDFDTGMGLAAADQLSLIAGGEQRLGIIDPGDVASGQVLQAYGPTRATSADNDEAYMSLFLDVDDGQEEMARIEWFASDVTTATEDGGIRLLGRQAGTVVDRLTVDGTGVRFDFPSSSYLTLGVAGSDQLETDITTLDFNTNTDVLFNHGTTARGMLWFTTTATRVGNRNSNGTVEIRANTSSAGSGGEVTAMTFEDDRITIDIQQSAAPGTPAAGDMYYDTDSNELCIYNGSAWTGLIGAGTCA